MEPLFSFLEEWGIRNAFWLFGRFGSCGELWGVCGLGRDWHCQLTHSHSLTHSSKKANSAFSVSLSLTHCVCISVDFRIWNFKREPHLGIFIPPSFTDWKLFISTILQFSTLSLFGVQVWEFVRVGCAVLHYFAPPPHFQICVIALFSHTTSTPTVSTEAISLFLYFAGFQNQSYRWIDRLLRSKWMNEWTNQPAHTHTLTPHSLISW